jgi:hypothetical protein
MTRAKRNKKWYSERKSQQRGKKKREKRSSKKLKKNKQKKKREVEAYLKAGESVGVALVVSSALWRRCHRKQSRFPFAFSPPTLDPFVVVGDGDDVRDDNNNSFPDDALVLSLALSSSPFGR